VFEVVAGHDDERVERSLWCGARVVGLEVAGHGCVEGGIDVFAREVISIGFQVEGAAEGAGRVTGPASERFFVGCGAVVAVDRVGDEPDETTQLVGGVVAGRGDQLWFDVRDLRGPVGGGCVRDDRGVRPGDLTERERFRHDRQLLELARQLHMTTSDANIHAAPRPHRRGRVQEPVDRPLTGTVVLRDLHEQRGHRGFVFAEPRFDLVHEPEHTFDNTRKDQ